MNIEGVDKYMPRVQEAIERHIKWPSPEFTDIYNRAYEAVAEVLIESQQENQRLRDEIRDLRNEMAKAASEINVRGPVSERIRILKHEAQEKIDILRVKNQRLREALGEIVKYGNRHEELGREFDEESYILLVNARAALSGEEN